MPDQNYSEPNLEQDTDHELLFKAAYAQWLIEQGGGSGGLPDQTGHAGEFLTTDGTTASWAPLAGGGDVVASGALTDNSIALGAGGTSIKVTPTGTGVVAALGVNIGNAGAPVLFDGAGGTPSSLVLTNATGLVTAGLVDDSVTYAKMQNVSAASRIIGRGSAAGSGDPEELTLGSGISLTGTVLSASGSGDMLKSVYDPRNVSRISGLPGADNGGTGGLGGDLEFVGGDGDTGALTGGAGGTISMNGGNAAYGIGNGGSSGIISMGGGNASGSNGGSGGSLLTNANDNFNGGTIDTSAASADGGSITTANGGGSINTQGVGLVEFGGAGTRTSLVGQAASDITVTLPSAATTLVGTGTTDTLTNKTINGPDNTLTNIALSSLASQSASTLVGRTSASAGSPTAITLGTGLSMSGTTLNVSGFATLGANTFTRLQTITQGTANEGILASTGYSLTGSNATSMVDLAGTWNTTGTPTAIKLNITDTASNAASLLVDLQKGGATQFSVTKSGTTTIGGDRTLKAGSGASLNIYGSAGNAIYFGTNTSVFGGLVRLDDSYLRMMNTLGLAWSADGNSFGTADTILTRQAAGVVASNGSFRTAAPSGGTAANWKFGTVASVSPTSPDRTIEIEVGGTTYYIHAKTTND